MPPASTQKSRKKSSRRTKKNAGDQIPPERLLVVHLASAAAAGALLGLSAPGFNQWYLAWCGLIPLLLLIVSSPSIGGAFVRGLIFGLFYNLVYANWCLGLHPLTWLGFNQWQSILLASSAWIAGCLQQGLIIGCYSALCRAIPLTGGFAPRQVDGRWCLPTLVVLPLAWVLIYNKFGNASDLLGIPWSMLEYSQYRELPLLQATRWIGGIGLGFLIVMFNTALAGLLATATAKLNWKSLASSSLNASLVQTLSSILIVTGIYTWGLSNISASKTNPTIPVSILQGNINIDMQKTKHRYSLDELTERYLKMAASCHSGICIFTESALPANLKSETKTQATLFRLARQQRLDLIIGSIDYDENMHPFNSAYGITGGGTLLPLVYHKRYLVPLGEYTPSLIKYCPEWLQRLTNTPAGGGFSAGRQAALLYLGRAKVAPVICFESLSPELVADSVRHGGELLVNLSDLAWFHDSMIGDQMLAFSVLRAVENKRYFVFAANSGPSAIIDPNGQITMRSTSGQAQVPKGEIGLDSEITPFTGWFR